MNAKHWSNNFAGIFLVAVIFLVITVAVDRHAPSAAYTPLLWFFALVGLLALGGWIWSASRLGKASTTRVLFDRR